MKFSESWLRSWTNPPVDTNTLVAQLTNAGLEVDAVEAVAPRFNGVVVGEVLSVRPHPDADKLRICQVNVGRGEPLTIVCGAANVQDGMRAPVALVGTALPGGLTIKKAKLRGVESLGMLCSAKELGLAETSSGLMPLPGDAPVGEEVWDYLALEDRSIEVDLTPNRGDCLGIAGIAREVGVLNRCPVTPPAMQPVAPAIDEVRPVTLESGGDCPRYVGRVIRNIDPAAPTPLWMQERLRRSGLRSISAVVDVTNYVLLELGQPMHAFDLDKLTGGIHVRRAREGEPITVLDGTGVSLDADTLVIADDTGPQALAGIMGGQGSGVTSSSQHLFLESAFFSPEVIAGRPRRYGMQTDSSHRFERGVDFELQRRAMERATELLLAIAGGRPGPVIEAVSEADLPPRPAIVLRAPRIGRVLGMEVAAETVEDVLSRLGMALERQGGQWRIIPPSFRFDMAIEVDLIEEIARVLGYDQVPSTTPLAHLDIRREPEATVGVSRLRDLLVDRGYQEAITYSFVDPSLQARLSPAEGAIGLSNPISADMGEMRTSLWPGLVQALRYNQNRQQPRVRLFESGLRFLQRAGGTVQEPMLAGIVAGSAYSEQWGAARRPVDFFDLKGDVEALLGFAGEPRTLVFTPAVHPALHPGQTAAVELGGEQAGLLGALHPALVAELGLDGPAYLFELRLPVITAGQVPVFEPLSRFPVIRRDLALIVDEAVSARAVQDCIGQAASDVLKNLQLFDVYRGEGIDSGKKSLALGLTLQAASRTLTDDEVDVLIGNVVAVLQQQLGATLRG